MFAVALAAHGWPEYGGQVLHDTVELQPAMNVSVQMCCHSGGSHQHLLLLMPRFEDELAAAGWHMETSGKMAAVLDGAAEQLAVPTSAVLQVFVGANGAALSSFEGPVRRSGRGNPALSASCCRRLRCE